MGYQRILVMVWSMVLWTAGAAIAADGLDVVTMKDGSIIYGEIVDLNAGTLRIKTGFGGGDGMVAVKWADVTQLTLGKGGSFTTKEGTIIQGQALPGKPGTLTLKAPPISVPVEVPIESVAAINIPPVQFTGNATVGISGTSGNSEFKNISALFDFVARGDKLRLTLMGRYIYGETSGQIVARNALGTIKLDFFITKRFYWFANAYFEQDTFQDLKLRTALGTGPGYQFIDKGDFGGIFSELTFYAEGGVAYFNEDFRTPTREDKSSVRGRWAVNLNWPIVKDRIAIYHNHEGYPSLENSKDFYILTNTGAALNLNAHFIIKPQVTWRYNNAPAPGTTGSDTIYLITFGYAL
jgi:putative salt-induced outer membrane protein YdiY